MIRKRLLVVDDEQSMCGMITDSLRSVGHDCKGVTDPVAAIQILEQNSFDLLISDIKMPRMDGVYLLQRVRQEHLDTDVILITGHSDQYSYGELIRQGAADFIIKPFRISELRAKVERVIRERNMIQELQDLNTTLEVLLRRAKKEKEKAFAGFSSGIEEVILPQVERLKKTTLNTEQVQHIEVIESSLRNMCSPFGRLSQEHASLSSMEVQVANLVRSGKRNKEIADILGISNNTVLSHRYNLRSKLGLKGKKINLRSFLNSN